MAWVKKSVNNLMVYTETVTLGEGTGSTASRYTSEIDFIPPGTPFMVITNTGATNTSGSMSDQLYCAYESGGTFYERVGTLRDCNYADDTNHGTAYRTLDTKARTRYVDPSYVGDAPYWKIRILTAAAESTNMTIGVAVIVDKNYIKNVVHP